MDQLHSCSNRILAHLHCRILSGSVHHRGAGTNHAVDGCRLRAEKSIKRAQDQLKKAAAKREADARKPKATGQKPGEEGFTSALFDQGVAAAEKMVRVQLAESKAGALELDYSKPFVICANEWVADARKDQSSFCLAMNEFKSAFDEARKAKKGIRVSKPADPSLMTSFEFKGLLSDALKKSKTGGCVPEESMPEELKPLMVGSFFGIDAGYDRVSGETLGLPAVRLTLEGTRQVVVTEILQLVGLMTANQVSGKMDVVRCSSFFKCLSASMISEYKAQCNLYASTLSPGEPSTCHVDPCVLSWCQLPLWGFAARSWCQ